VNGQGDVADGIEAERLALEGYEFLSGPEWRPVVRRYALGREACGGAKMSLKGDATRQLPRPDLGKPGARGATRQLSTWRSTPLLGLFEVAGFPGAVEGRLLGP
jgi:hypothetical protein